MVRWLGILLRTLRSTVGTHRELALENLALRQQLAVWKRREPRPRLTALDRIFRVVLSRFWKSWRSSLHMVRPETVVGWHRQGFRRYWAWKSRRRGGRPIRRECLDHVVVIGERHLQGILSEYVGYYNGTRTHLSLTKDAPEPRSVQPPSRGRVVEVPRVGGFHHEYFRRAA